MPTLDWDDPEGIALALLEKYPEDDPLTIRFTDLRNRVLELEDFAGNAAASNEGRLEAIQMAWWEEWKDSRE